MARKPKTVVAPVETNLEVVGQVPQTEVSTATPEIQPETVVVVEANLPEVVDLIDDETVETSQPSELASMLMQEVKPLEEVKVEDKPATIQVEKNVGVGQFVRKLIADGMANKDILKVVHEQYGNTNTTYACVAWYRNKMKKTAQAKVQSTAVEQVTKMLEGDETEVKVEETKTES